MKSGHLSAEKLGTSAMYDALLHDDVVIRGGLCLLAGEGLVPADVVCAGGKIAALRAEGAAAGPGIDARGCLVLPGIVDIHGDAFERQIMPRAKTAFPLDVAMLETDRQLAANGITTAYHGITVSWEPGLRSLGEALRIIGVLDRLEGDFLVDHRIHIRWETFALDALAEVEALFARRKKPLLAFNDHTGPTLAGARADNKVGSSAERAMVDVPSYLKLLNKAGERAAEVPAAIEALARSARAKGVPMLSHDDVSPDMRAHFRGLGARVAEFPMNRDTLAAAAGAGDVIVLGAPNVVRGGSHNGAIGAEEAIRDGKCSVLASDYYYPAQLAAVRALDAKGVLALDRGWPMISSAAAEAADLADRGVIAEGQRADLVILPERGLRPMATISGGRIVFRSH
ncbi:MAG: alpha-D-ribose 1-methylphosphonate 5-triphosphate diphosphatase [Aestuariivirga sp.]|nr:alpha-D-ribose 1-methylphosphonate 5-triphosphate diphosphatase [Aestuariivirga sp.]